MNTTILTSKNIKTKTLATIVAIISAIVLPQILHAVGIVSGTGAMLGTAFLPMHLPIIAIGLIAGPIVGLVAGMLSPMLSFFLTGMPTSVLMPFMVIELGVYGLCAGLIKDVSMNTFFKVLIAQVAGRIIRAMLYFQLSTFLVLLHQIHL